MIDVTVWNKGRWWWGYLQHLNRKANEMNECCQESLATVSCITAASLS